MRLTRQRKTKKPCACCGLNPSLCLCEQIPNLNLSTRVLLVIHAKELKRTTNSGRLALAALTNSQMLVRGVKGETIDFAPHLSEEYESLLFFPSAEALILDKNLMAQIKKPVQLIVPDGSWRQASKVPTRYPELRSLKRVMIKTPNTAQYHLRQESSEFGMSTLEAIAKALGVIEGKNVEDEMQKLYELKLQRTLIGRGIRVGVKNSESI